MLDLAAEIMEHSDSSEERKLTYDRFIKQTVNEVVTPQKILGWKRA
jgi:hypothetical protein